MHISNQLVEHSDDGLQQSQLGKSKKSSTRHKRDLIATKIPTKSNLSKSMFKQGALNLQPSQAVKSGKGTAREACNLIALKTPVCTVESRSHFIVGMKRTDELVCQVL